MVASGVKQGTPQQPPLKRRKRRQKAGEGTNVCAACFLRKSDIREAYCTACIGNGGEIRRAAGSNGHASSTIAALSEQQQLWLGSEQVQINPLDASFCEDFEQNYSAGNSRLYVYPVTSYVLPALFVATVFINHLAKTSGRRSALPSILWYTPTDGRELFARLRFGKKRNSVSEICGTARINTDGQRIGSTPRKVRLCLTGHPVLPKDRSWSPDAVIVDTHHFGDVASVKLLTAVRNEWPHVRTFAITSDPLTPLRDCFESVLDGTAKDTLQLPSLQIGRDIPENAFASVAVQLNTFASGVERTVEIVAETPSPRWNDLRDVFPLAKRNVGSLVTARLFLAAVKWVSGLPVRPSEFEANRTLLMSSFEDWLSRIRRTARDEGTTAMLIAGATTVLRDICTDLERDNQKHAALMRAINDQSEQGRRVAIIVQRVGMRNVLRQALLAATMDGELSDDGQSRASVSVMTTEQLFRAETCDLVIVPALLPHGMLWALRAAIAPEMKILSYGCETAHWEWSLNEAGAAGQPLRRSTAPDGPRQADAAPQNRSFEAALSLDLASLVADDLDEVDLSLPWSESSSTQTARRCISFQDDSEVTVADSSIVQVVDEQEQIRETRARDIKVGDMLLIANGGPLRDLFDLLRERVDSQTGLARAVEIVKAFHQLLEHAFRRSEMTYETLRDKLRAIGSRIIHPVSIAEWVEGERFGPIDPLDIERLGRIFSIDTFATSYSQYYSSMQRVRIAHRELGRALVRLVHASYADADANSIRLTVEGEDVVLYDISDAITLKRVVTITIIPAE